MTKSEYFLNYVNKLIKTPLGTIGMVSAGCTVDAYTEKLESCSIRLSIGQGAKFMRVHPIYLQQCEILN